MSRVSAGVSELTRRRPARRRPGDPAGVGLRSLRCSLGSAIKDVELGVEYRRVAAGFCRPCCSWRRLLHGARSGSDKALPKSTDTRRPRLVSQKLKRHRQRLHPLLAKLASATIKGARKPPHYAQQGLAMLPPHYVRQIWHLRSHLWSGRGRDGRSAPRGGLQAIRRRR